MAIGAAAAAGSTIALAEEPAESSEEAPVSADSQVQCDVVVVGAGAAGLSAALSCLQEGVKDVIVLEKAPGYAGHTSNASGVLAGCSQWQKDCLGIYEDSPQAIFDDMMVCGEYVNQQDLVWLVANNMGRSFDWLIENGVPFNTEPTAGVTGEQFTRLFDVVGGGIELLNVLGERIEEEGGSIQFETRGMELLTDDEGAVIGIRAEGPSGDLIDYYCDAVVLATAGYGGARELFRGQLAEVNPVFYGTPTTTGDGYYMATAIDAGITSNMGWTTFGCDSVNVGDDFARRASSALPATAALSAIFVNIDGKRFIDEETGRSADTFKVQPDKAGYYVMDQDSYDVFGEAFATASQRAINVTRMSLEEQAERFADPNDKVFVMSPDLAEAGQLAGINPEALCETVEHWNEMCAAGEDTDFGRADLTPIATEDTVYYIVQIRPVFCMTFGGIAVNDKLEVQHKLGASIDGLYAVGECTGGVHGHGSLSGCNIGWGVYGGKVVGEVIAEKLAAAEA